MCRSSVLSQFIKCIGCQAGPSHERVSQELLYRGQPGLSLVSNIHPLLLIGQRLYVATCPAHYELLFEELSARDMV